MLVPNRKVLVASRVSTLYRDRAAQAGPTAQLMARCIEAVPGNVAAYFPSFAMLEDISGRWAFSDRELIVRKVLTTPITDANLRDALDEVLADAPASE